VSLADHSCLHNGQYSIAPYAVMRSTMAMGFRQAGQMRPVLGGVGFSMPKTLQPDGRTDILQSLNNPLMALA